MRNDIIWQAVTNYRSCASLNGARFVHFDPAPVPIGAKTRSAYQLVGIDATCCLAPDQPRLLRLFHQSMQILFVLAVALGQHAQPSCNLCLGLLEFLAPAGRERWILLDILAGVLHRKGGPRQSCEQDRESRADDALTFSRAFADTHARAAE